jgi:hypothetical protein
VKNKVHTTGRNEGKIYQKIKKVKNKGNRKRSIRKKERHEVIMRVSEQYFIKVMEKIIWYTLLR